MVTDNVYLEIYGHVRRHEAERMIQIETKERYSEMKAEQTEKEVPTCAPRV